MGNTIDAKMQKKREKIMAVALHLFAVKGYVNTPVRDIIDESGFGTGTFYKYFANKEDVLKQLLADFLEQIIASVNNYYKEESDLYLRFIETKRVILKEYIRNEKVAGICCRAAGLSAGIDQCLKEFDDKFLLFIGKNIQYGITEGIFRDFPIMPIANATLALIKYLVYKWIVLKEITEEEMLDMATSFHQSLAIGLVIEGSRGGQAF
ncbi:MAG TPA: TetR/AcrR family transcriptional regulator [Syntrophomonadaceae bacterium]|nr:TetR/AcrR family transcriptional regulator [Syntrophomonadaceae bacterium]